MISIAKITDDEIPVGVLSTFSLKAFQHGFESRPKVSDGSTPFDPQYVNRLSPCTNIRQKPKLLAFL